MYVEIAWALVSSGTRVQPQIMPNPDCLPDYLSISYDYDHIFLVIMNMQYIELVFQSLFRLVFKVFKSSNLLIHRTSIIFLGFTSMSVHSFQSFLLEIPFSRILFKGVNRGFMKDFKNSLACVRLVVVIRMSMVKQQSQ